jgi:hypothetical protein
MDFGTITKFNLRQSKIFNIKHEFKMKKRFSLNYFKSYLNILSKVFLYG